MNSESPGLSPGSATDGFVRLWISYFEYECPIIRKGIIIVLIVMFHSYCEETMIFVIPFKC